jgi:amino acid transporter
MKTIFTNWKTSLIGLITIVISSLVLFGVVTPEQSSDITEHSNSIINSVALIVSNIAGMVLIFKAKD